MVKHKRTTFHNRHPYIDYMELFEKDKKFNSIKDSDISNSWIDWTFDVDEDDICFSPSSLMHSVSQVKSDDLETIIINVDIY